jgi:dienelactone hydrolase
VKQKTFSSLLALCACFSLGSAAAQTSPFQFLEKPGRYPVGLKVVNQYDHSRTFPSSSGDSKNPSVGDSPRPLQTLIWYPSAGSNDKPMSVGDYARLADTEISLRAPGQSNRWNSLLAATSSVALWAVADAPLAEGRFPVIIYAPGDSSVSWENADLCEYLASHGYVVLASPSMGASIRDMTEDLDGVNAQARDISFLISYANTLPDADVSEVAVAGWSWGGISNLFAAARDRRVHALIALDGSMRYYPGLVKKAGDVHPERMTLPLLFFALGEFTLEDLDQNPSADKFGPNVLNAWTHGDLLTVYMLGMAHPEFSSMFQRRETAKRFAENQKADYGRDDANTGYAWVARYTVEFLDAYLKHDAAATAFLKRTPAENGVPKHFMDTHYRSKGRTNSDGCRVRGTC